MLQNGDEQLVPLATTLATTTDSKILYKQASSDHYSHFNKSFNNMPNTSRPNRINSLPNGDSHQHHNHNHNAGGVLFDRMASTVSQYTTTNSVLKLVVDDENRPKKPAKTCRCRGNLLWLLVFVFFCSTISLGTLYVLGLENGGNTMTSPRTVPMTKMSSCFIRARAKPLPNVTNEPEIKEALRNSQAKVFAALSNSSNNIHAFSSSIYYMGEEIWSLSFGSMDFRNKSNQTRPTEDTPYPIASVAKVFTILMLQKLLEDGTIKDIDDDITLYEKSFLIHNPFNKKPVTFRQLACMMSGIQRESPCYPPNKYNYCPYTNQEMFNRVNNTTLLLPPNQSPMYSNLGIAILGHILERQLKNNQSYENWIMENIVKPLNMTNTGFDILNRTSEFPVSTAKGDNIAESYDWGWINPSGGMYSTSTDLGKLGKLFTADDFDTTSIISQKRIDRLLKPEFLWPNSAGQGCPFEIMSIDPTFTSNVQQQRKLGYMLYTKRGNVFGYDTKFTLLPDMQLNFNVITARAEGQTGDITDILLAEFAKGFHNLLTRKDKEYKLPANHEFFVGSYKQKTNWSLITQPCNITLEQGKLYVRLEWLRTPLSYYSDNVLKILYTEEVPRMCPLLGDGIMHEKFFFHPSNSHVKATGFHINGISLYGHVEFERIGD